jgi:hypothetical protein
MLRLLKRPLFFLLIVVTLAPSAAILASWTELPFLENLTRNRLYGSTEWVPPPPRKLPAFWSGTFQERFGPWLASRMGYPREVLLRWNNGIGYLVGRSHASEVYIGRDRMLYESAYIRDWCSNPPDDIRIARLAERIDELSRRITAAGRTFLLVFSPSKAAVYPEDVGRPCGETNGNRRFNQLKKALQLYRIPTVDGSALLREARKQEPLPLFGRDGLHWNQLGASIVANEMFRTIGDLSGRPARQLTVKNVAVTDRPVAVDRDLSGTLNLPFELRPYPSPHVTFAATPEGYAPRILIVGTSFTWAVLELIAAHDLAQDATFYFYFSRIARTADGSVHTGETSFAANRDLPATFDKTEVVILEINEANVLSSHTEKFARALDRHLGFAPRKTVKRNKKT